MFYIFEQINDMQLRIMSELTEKNGDEAASIYWKETMYKKHEGLLCAAGVTK